MQKQFIRKLTPNNPSIKHNKMNLPKVLEPSFINLKIPKIISSITSYAIPVPTATNYENISSINSSKTVCNPCKKKFMLNISSITSTLVLTHPIPQRIFERATKTWNEAVMER